MGESWEIKHYRNTKLKAWIEANFKSDIEREGAWRVVAYIKDTWPETVPILRGEEVK